MKYLFLVSFGVLSAPITHSSGRCPSFIAVCHKSSMTVLICISAPCRQSSKTVVIWWLVCVVPLHCEPTMDTCSLAPLLKRGVFISAQIVGRIPAVWSILSIFMNHFLLSLAAQSSYFLNIIAFITQPAQKSDLQPALHGTAINDRSVNRTRKPNDPTNVGTLTLTSCFLISFWIIVCICCIACCWLFIIYLRSSFSLLGLFLNYLNHEWR